MTSPRYILSLSPDAWTAITTGGLLVATGVLAWVTWQYVKETRKLAKAAAESTEAAKASARSAELYASIAQAALAIDFTVEYVFVEENTPDTFVRVECTGPTVFVHGLSSTGGAVHVKGRLKLVGLFEFDRLWPKPSKPEPIGLVGKGSIRVGSLQAVHSSEDIARISAAAYPPRARMPCTRVQGSSGTGSQDAGRELVIRPLDYD